MFTGADAIPELADIPDLPHPMHPAELMASAFHGVDLGPVAVERARDSALRPSDASPLMDLSLILQCYGRRDEALACQRRALDLSRLYRYPAPGADGMRLLIFAAAGDLTVNMPIELILRGRDVDLTALYLRPDETLPDRVPDHDLAMVAVSEFDETRGTLERLAGIAAAWPRPVLNDPRRILDLSRDRLSRLLRDAPGLLSPPTARIVRADLGAVAAGKAAIADFLARGTFPIIARPVGSHGGKGLARLRDARAIASFLAAQPANEFYVAPFVDIQAADGRYRKYRVALIERRPFLCHLAISDHWMVNYQNAAMDLDPLKRAEESRAFETFDDVFVPRHARALGALDDRIGLDYAVIDCAETPDGALLVFEADNAAVIHDLDPPALYPYKQAPMRKAFDAFHAMLRMAARRGHGLCQRGTSGAD